MTLHIGLLTSELAQRHGWAQYSLHLARALKRAGVRLTILAARNHTPDPDLPARAMLPTVDPLQRGLWARQMALLPTARAALAACDIVHSTVELYAPLAARIAGSRPLFITGHGSYVRFDKLPGLTGRALGSAFRRASRRGAVVCVSEYTARQLAAIAPDVRTTVIPNGVDAARYADIARQNASRFAVSRAPDAPLRLLSVGAVKARKGTRQLVHGVHHARAAGMEVCADIVGSLTADRDYTGSIEAEIDRLGVQNCVNLRGFLPEAALMEAYSEADAFVLPSMNSDWKFEGYGLALMEASAAGLPVIGTRDCGAESVIDHQVTGLLLAQATIVDELPGAFRLMMDDARAAQMGIAGRAKAESNTWDRVAADMIAAYETAMR